MKIILDRDKCIGCGSCQAICPKYFELDDNGKSHLIGSIVDKKNKNEELEITEIDCTKDAVDACPTQAIVISE